MIILGIETSCDETALALIETRPAGAEQSAPGGIECRVISSLVHSQADLHNAYGGVYPSLAKREHGRNLVPLLHKILEGLPVQEPVEPSHYARTIESFRHEIEPQNPELFESFAAAGFLKNKPFIDRIAVTEGPGLEPALWVGINLARMLGELWGIPVAPVDHMEGHIVGSLLSEDSPSAGWQRLRTLPAPALALLISGGHTELVEIGSVGRYKIIGQTKDDAVGEAFDKVARLLGLPYPGGPHVSKLSHEAFEEGISSPIKLPRPMISSGDLHFSFSGLKTAVLYAIRDHYKETGTENGKALPDAFRKGLAREFEQAVSDTLVSKLQAAIEKTGARAVIIGGGVSANHALRSRFQALAAEFDLPLYMPSSHVSGDNALMIALASALHPAEPRAMKASGTARL
ncbi:tRNA (adenosine(37)-N6)-threonylcarbamoyltransferase complex transferase subunit TsaD [Patescibacteria group bacterium]|nr:tRNA (adenosine(37)-N6)-threonylcarbamoyltransferase complex transferase subunit TsaD [Patescibacteria group bacterium]